MIYDINFFNEWRNAVKDLAKIAGGEVREINTCCPHVRFETAGAVCVAYLYSATNTPAICLNGARLDAEKYGVKTLLDIMYYHFA